MSRPLDRRELSVVGVRDVPIEDDHEDEKGLKVSDYADALAEFIRRTDTPMTVGIQGDWGSGKTSLMKLIEGRLNPKQGAGTCPTIWINTWKYAQTEPGQALAVAIFLAIIHRLAGISGEEGIRQFIRQAGRFLFAVASKAIQAQVGVKLEAPTEKSELDQIFDRYEALERLREQLQRLVSNAIAGQKGDRVVVFVDDLDRVQPERAVEILEVLKVFLDIEGLVFVLACDYEVIVKGLRAKAGLGEEVSGRSFFDKIIQVPFQVPMPSREKLKTYVQTLVGRVVSEARLTEQDLETVIEVLQRTTGTNPRTIKRLVNVVNLLLLILDSEKHTWDNEVTKKPVIVFTLVALQNAYPEFYAFLSDRGVDAMFDQVSDEDVDADPRLARLQERKPDLKVETLNELLDILKRLVGGDAGLLANFIAVSDMAAVKSKEEPMKPPTGLSRGAREYIESQPREAQDIIWRVIGGDLPETVTVRRTRGGESILLYDKENKEYWAEVWCRRRARRVEFGFNATSEHTITSRGGPTFLDKMREFGCPGVQERSPEWQGLLSCRVGFGADPDGQEVEAVRKFLRWFLLEAPGLWEE